MPAAGIQAAFRMHRTYITFQTWEKTSILVQNITEHAEVQNCRETVMSGKGFLLWSFRLHVRE